MYTTCNFVFIDPKSRKSVGSIRGRIDIDDDDYWHRYWAHAAGRWLATELVAFCAAMAQRKKGGEPTIRKAKNWVVKALAAISPDYEIMDSATLKDVTYDCVDVRSKHDMYALYEFGECLAYREIDCTFVVTLPQSSEFQIDWVGNGYGSGAARELVSFFSDPNRHNSIHYETQNLEIICKPKNGDDREVILLTDAKKPFTLHQLFEAIDFHAIEWEREIKGAISKLGLRARMTRKKASVRYDTITFRSSGGVEFQGDGVYICGYGVGDVYGNFERS